MNEKVNGNEEVGAPGDREVHRHYDRAKAAFGGGDLPEAARHCGEALEREPDFLPALELGGVIACSQGDFATGIERFRRLTERVPENPGAHFNLGNALLNAGRPKDALAALGEANELEPGNPGILVTMGICKRRIGEYEAAEEFLKSALERSPRNLAALNALGATYAEQHRYEDAHGVFKEAVSIEPRSPQLRHNVGNMLLEMAHYTEAADEFRAVLTLDARDADARAGLGAALAGRGDYDEAIHHFRRALKHAPDHGRALYGLIDTLEHEGRIAEAQELLQPALEANPDDANLLFLQARLARRDGDDEAAAEAVSAAEAAGVPASLEDRFFAEAGAIHDRAGNRERAMLAFTRANAATAKRWRAASPGPNAFMARVERVTRALEQRQTDADAATTSDVRAEDSPVFLVGFPRSGTTLLGQMCNAHPALAAVDETPALGRLADRVDTELGGYPDGLENIDSDRLADFRAAYWARFEDRPDGVRLVDKMPFNLIHGLLVDKLFPGAPVVWLVRDPRDVCLSYFMQSFDLNSAMANFFTLESTVRCYASVMSQWALAREKLNLNVHVVRYEELVAEPEDHLSALCEFLGLPWDPVMLDYRTAPARGIRTPSYREVSQALYKGSIGRWRHYEAYLEELLPRLQPWIEALGYEGDASE